MTTPLTITSLDQGKIAPRYTSDETYWAHFHALPQPKTDKMPRRAYLMIVRALWPFRLASAKGQNAHRTPAP